MCFFFTILLLAAGFVAPFGLPQNPIKKTKTKKTSQDLVLPCNDSEIVKKFYSLDRKLAHELNGSTSGATCVAACVKCSTSANQVKSFTIKVANIGDSRAVLVRNGGLLSVFWFVLFSLGGTELFK